jgi:oxygen-independent coproporphyrinogen-3 oxidase
VDALLTELKGQAGALADGPFTVFVGGGTPTVLPDDQLSRLVKAVGEHVDESAGVEFTVEANPATLTTSNAAILRRFGANRISMGAQSFDPADLAVLERIHSPEDIGPGVRIARNAGFEEVNLDLIFAIPGQTMARWLDSLEKALSLEPEHLACYALTFEPNTVLTAKMQHGRITPCDENLEADMLLAARDRLTSEGFEHYEVSNYARPGYRCVHNVNYWRNKPYLGVGPSAVSYLDGVRRKNIADWAKYTTMINETGMAAVESETLSDFHRAGETAWLALRLADGIDPALFRIQTGLSAGDVFAESMARHAADGHLVVNDASIRVSTSGLLLTDLIAADFLNEAMEQDPSRDRRSRKLPILG